MTTGVAPHTGVIDFGVFTPPISGKDGIQGEVPAPLAGQSGWFLSTDGWKITNPAGAGSVTDVNTTAPIMGGPFTVTGTISLAPGGVTNHFLAPIAANHLKGSITGVGDPVDLTAAQVKTMLSISAADIAGLGALATQNTVNLSTQATGTLQAAQEPAHLGDVTNAAGNLTLTIGAAKVTTAKIADGAVTTVKLDDLSVSTAKLVNAAVTNAKLASMAVNTIKGALTAGTPVDLSVAQVTNLLSVFSRTAKGLVPQAPTGSAITAFLREDGIWAAPPPQTSIAWSAITGKPTTVAGYGITDAVTLTGTQTLTNKSISTSQLTGTLLAAQEPAHTGDVTNTAGSLALTIPNGKVTNAKLATAPAKTFKANNTTAVAAPTDITAAAAKTLLAITAADVGGLGALATANSVNLTTQATGILQVAQAPAFVGGDVTSTSGSLKLVANPAKIHVNGGTGLFADGALATPSIAFASDLDTGFFTDAAGAIVMTMNGVERTRFQDVTMSRGGGPTSISGMGAYNTFAGGGNMSNIAQVFINASQAGPILYLGKSKSGTWTDANLGYAPVINNTTLGSVQFWGANGTTMQQMSYIAAYVDGVPFGVNPTDRPTRLSFWTAGPTGGPIQRLQLNKDGVATFWTNAILSARVDPAGAATVNGQTIITQEKGDARYLTAASGDGKYLKLTGGTVNGAVAVNGQLSSQGTIYAGLNGSGGSLIARGEANSVPAIQTQNSAGLVLSNHYYDFTNGLVAYVNNQSGSTLQLLADGGAWFSGAVASVKGYKTKNGGMDAALQGNVFNINWQGNSHLWIDNSHQGQFSFVCDYRIKKDVKPLPSTWDKVKTLKPISYSIKEFTPPENLRADPDAKPMFLNDDTELWGFIAHELQEDLIPSAASGEKDKENCIQSPHPWVMLATLTKALQEAMERIEMLEAQLA